MSTLITRAQQLRYTEKCNCEIPRAFVETVLLTPKPRDKGLLKAAMDAIWDLPRNTLSILTISSDTAAPVLGLRDPKTSPRRQFAESGQ